MRRLRTAVFSLVALILGLVGHATASHTICATDLRGVLLLSPLVGGVGWLLAGRERGYLPLLLGTYTVQALLHLVLHGSAIPGAGMLTVHLLAGAVAACGLRHGERTAARFEVVRAAGSHVLRTLAALAALVAALPDVAAGLPVRIVAWLNTLCTPWRPRCCWTVATAITRGPPLAAR